MSGRELIIVGDGELAELAYEYFTHDSPHTVVAFAVERAFLRREEFLGLPVVPFEELQRHYPASRYAAHVAVSAIRLNRVRARLYDEARGKGFELLSYVSSKAFVWHSAEIGDNCLIFEGNVIQHGVKVGNDVIMWSSNHLGHRCRVGDHCFFASHVVVAGFTQIGTCCYLGMNSSLAEFLTIGDDCVVGGNAMVLQSTERGGVYRGNPAARARVSSYLMFGIAAEDTPAGR